MGFIESMEKVLNEDYNNSVTENGALGYRTTGYEILDFNFKVSSYRNASEDTIIKDFMKVFYGDKLVAMKLLFFIRDRDEGLGERRLFRVIIKHLANVETEMIKAICPLIAEYGRYDDLLELFDTQVEKTVMSLISEQLLKDVKDEKNNKPISLLAKWLPSINQKTTHERTIRKKIKQLKALLVLHEINSKFAKNLKEFEGSKTKINETEEQLKKLNVELEQIGEKETNIKAKKIIKYCKTTCKEYRKTISKLRKHIDVTERKMCAKEWGEIKYENVPSRANLNYNNAFLKHDEERRRKFLEQVQKGEKKINSGKLYPHDIVHKYRSSYKREDSTLEELWKALPKKEIANTLVVADGSGSMTSTIGKTNVSCLDVANALAIYFAEHNKGEFYNQYITFSENPQLVKFDSKDSLCDKIYKCMCHNEVANTNIEAVFDLILDTAIQNNMVQDEMPKNILIISDMEFDNCVTTETSGWSAVRPTQKLFKTFEKKYKDNGYKLPRLIFWNVDSRTGTIPMKENDLGVALVSGFSTNIAEMVMNDKLDPLEILLDKINSKRYEKVEECLKNVLK